MIRILFVLLLTFVLGHSNFVFAEMEIPPNNSTQSYLPQNVFKNPGFETNANIGTSATHKGICKTQADTGATTTPIEPLGTFPYDCTNNGNASITLGTTTTDPIEGFRSFTIAKGATNRQRDMVFMDEIDLQKSTLQGESLLYSFRYSKAATNFVYGDSSDIRVYFIAYDNLGSDQIFINPGLSTLDGSGNFATLVQTPKRYLRPILYVATTNANAWTMKIDAQGLAISKGQFIPYQTDWQPYSPDPAINQGFGTISVANSKLEWRQDGPDILIRGYFQSGTVTSSEARVALPNSFTTGGTNNSSAGIYFRNISTIGKGGAIRSIAGSKYFTFTITNTISGADVNPNLDAAGNQVATNNDYIIINSLRIPIQGWTSGAKTQGQILQNVPVTFKATKNGGSITNDAIIPSWTTQDDSMGWFNPTTGVYTVNRAGLKLLVIGNLQQTSTNTNQLQVWVNGSAYQSGNGNGGVLKGVTAFIPNTTVGMTIDLRSSTSETVASNNIGTSFEVLKWNDPSTFSTLNRTTTKYLPSNLVTSTNPVSSLAFNNMIVGKLYKVTTVQSVLTNAAAVSSNLYVVHNGNTVSNNYIQTSAGTVRANNSTSGAPFIATATSISVTWTVSGSGGTLYGTNNAEGTYIILEELNNTVPGNF